MTKTLLEKMFYKSEYSLCVHHLPEELKEKFEINDKLHTRLDTIYGFILSFYTKKDMLEKEVVQLIKSLENNGILWVAYPKGKALATDLNRDIMHTLMAKHALDGVSLVSLSDTWSAMRFKRPNSK